MEEKLKGILEKNMGLTKEGKLADYIPALTKADPNDLAICLVDMDRNSYKVGQYGKSFTIQSISKVIALIQAITDNGREQVFDRVGYEGTDEAFNSLYKLDLPTGEKPANPMINSGAIVTTSLIKGDKEEKFNKILKLTRLMANNPTIGYDEEVYLSEKATGDKNRAMAYLMKAKGIFDGEVEDVLDAYFKQCSIEVDALDLANIAICIAGGLKELELANSIPREELTSLVIGIMANCGMYNSSGQYMVDVGIPSKSGVAGGIMAVAPGKMGIGIYGPALNENGNSIGGSGIMKDLAKELNLKAW